MAALPYEYDNAAIVFVTVAPASLLASSYIVNSYLRWSEVRTPAFSLVFAMAVADIFYGIKFIVTGADRLLDTQTGLLSGASPACTALGILGQLAGMATLSYNGAIAVNVYFTLERPFRYKPELWVPRYHGFVVRCAWSPPPPLPPCSSTAHRTMPAAGLPQSRMAAYS